MDNKLTKLKKILQKADTIKGNAFLAKELVDLEDKINSALEEIKDTEATTNKVVEGLKKLKDGKDGGDGKDGKDGRDGENYKLTTKDKKEIAKSIKVPVVEKVIEKTETIIKEQPIVTNEIKEVAVADEPNEIVEKLQSLKDDNRLDASAIKNLPDIEKIARIAGRQSSKTVSIGELENVDVSHTQTEAGKYILGNSWDKPYGSATFTYDVDGNIETKLVGDTELTYAYDVDGNVESITNGTYTKSFVYNVDGDVEAINYS